MNYKYKIRLGGDKTLDSHEKELVIIKRENGSVTIRVPGSDASIVRFWPDGNIYLYEDEARIRGFSPNMV